MLSVVSGRMPYAIGVPFVEEARQLGSYSDDSNMIFASYICLMCTQVSGSKICRTAHTWLAVPGSSPTS